MELWCNDECYSTYKGKTILFHSGSTIMVEPLSFLGTRGTKVIVVEKLFTSECVNIFFSFTSTEIMVSMVTIRFQTIWTFCNLFVYTSPIIERLHNSVNFHRVKTVNNNTKHERMQKLGILVTTW